MTSGERTIVTHSTFASLHRNSTRHTHSLSLKLNHRIVEQIVHVYRFAFLNHIGMLFDHQPANVTEEETATLRVHIVRRISNY